MPVLSFAWYCRVSRQDIGMDARNGTETHQRHLNMNMNMNLTKFVSLQIFLQCMMGDGRKHHGSYVRLFFFFQKDITASHTSRRIRDGCAKNMME